MKNKKNLLFGLTILTIYIVTILAYSVSLYREYKDGPYRAEDRFRELVRETNQNILVNNPRTESFTNTFLRSIGEVSDIAGIQLVEENDLLIAYPSNLQESKVDSKFVKTLSETMYSQEGKKLTLTAAFYTLKPDSLHQKGLVAFLVLLVSTLCCIAYLIINLMVSGSANKKPEIKNEPEDDDSSSFFEDDELFIEDSLRIENDLKDENDLPEEEPPAVEENSTGTGEVDDDYSGDESSDTTFEAPEIIEDDANIDSSTDNENQSPVEDAVAEQPSDSENYDIGFDEDDTQNDFPYDNPDDSDMEDSFDMDSSILPIGSNITQEEYQALTKDLIPEENEISLPAVMEKKELSPDEYVLKPIPVFEAKKEEKPARKRGTPEGLFSPATGFCWEEYMMPRLDSELMRAASSDQDLALFTLSIPKFDWESDSGKAICSIIQSTFKFRDMIFEYKDSGCTVISLGIDSRQALEKAENLHTDIIAELAKRCEYHIVSIGIANRSLRLISGSRLANESEQALFHALEDKESPIVAFKINPEKYRNFIAEETAKQEMAIKKNEQTDMEI